MRVKERTPKITSVGTFGGMRSEHRPFLCLRCISERGMANRRGIMYLG